MRPEVRDGFAAFSTTFEGYVDFLYLDVKYLVTTAIGVLVDPVDLALGLPFVHPDGTPATRAEVFGAWSAVKARRDLAPRGGMAFHGVTTIRLTQDGVSEVVGRKLDQMDRAMAKRFPNWEGLPANAQTATLSLCWACGAAFRFPRLDAAIRAEDWVTAADECEIDPTGNPGVIPRSAAQRSLYLSCLPAE